MPLMVLDVATAPIANAADYEPEAIKAPKNYKDAAKILEYEDKQRAKVGEDAALDFDLSRITGIGTLDPALGPEPAIALFRTDGEEKYGVQALADLVFGTPDLTLVTFNGMAFDLPALMRRARYLGLTFPRFQLEHWKS